MTEEGAPQNGPETSPGQIDNPEISARFQAKQAEKAQIQAESLSIAQRLSRRGQNETVKIPFSDDLGEFIVEVRLPTTAELNELLKFDKMVTAAKGNNDEIDAATDQLCEKLGELAVDPSLDKEFFKGGAFLASDLSQIIKEIMLEEERRIKQVKSFRKDAVRA